MFFFPSPAYRCALAVKKQRQKDAIAKGAPRVLVRIHGVLRSSILAPSLRVLNRKFPCLLRACGQRARMPFEVIVVLQASAWVHEEWRKSRGHWPGFVLCGSRLGRRLCCWLRNDSALPWLFRFPRFGSKRRLAWNSFRTTRAKALQRAPSFPRLGEFPLPGHRQFPNPSGFFLSWEF